MSEEKKVSEAVESMAKAIEKHIEIDHKTGAGSEKENVFEKTLPEDLSIEVVKKVNDHNSNFIAAGAMAFGQLSVKAMSKNNDLNETDLKLKMAGRDHVQYHMAREKTYANHLTGNGENVTKYGVITAEYNVSGGRNSGQLKHVRDMVSEMAEKAFHKK